MRFAIFSTHPTWVTHLETELEIAQKLLNRGDDVDFYICSDSSFSCCENILSRSLLDKQEYGELKDINCEFCINRQNRGFDLLKGKINKYPLINNQQRNFEYHFDESLFNSVDDLKELYYDEIYDIGWSLISSFVSFTRKPFFKIDENLEMIKRLYSDSIKVYESSKDAILKNKYDGLYVFNARLSYTRGLFRLGQKLNIPVYVHERGSVPEKYEIYPDNTPHNINFFYNEVIRYWRKDLGIKRYFIGKQFFQKKKNGFAGSWKSFTTNFENGILPDSFNPNLENIILFTSSEDEFQSIDKTWNNPFFENQLKGIEYLCEKISKKTNQMLYIRVHPNSIDMETGYLEKMFSYSEYKNVEVIPPNSKVNSYDLILNSSKIISFGSTLTIEAIYWGKPVILLANSFYNKFNGPIVPKNFNEIIYLCFEKKISKPTKKDVIKVGYYLNTFGEKYDYYNSIDYKTGYFKGVNLSTGELLVLPEPRITTFINRIKGFLYPIYSLIKKI